MKKQVISLSILISFFNMKTTTIIFLITLSLSANAQNIQQRDSILRKEKGISEM